MSNCGGWIYIEYDLQWEMIFLYNGKSVIQSDGAGIYLVNASPHFTNMKVRYNSAQKKGGAIYIDEDSHPLITYCFFYDNTANEGGAIYNYGIAVDVSDTLDYYTKPRLECVCMINDNYASVNGGGIFNRGLLWMANVTVADNRADNGLANI